VNRNGIGVVCGNAVEFILESAGQRSRPERGSRRISVE
jgi:hypothetical protein